MAPLAFFHFFRSKKKIQKKSHTAYKKTKISFRVCVSLFSLRKAQKNGGEQEEEQQRLFVHDFYFVAAVRGNEKP